MPIITPINVAAGHRRRDRAARQRRERKIRDRDIIRRLRRLEVDPAWIEDSYNPEIEALAGPSAIDSRWIVPTMIIATILAMIVLAIRHLAFD